MNQSGSMVNHPPQQQELVEASNDSHTTLDQQEDVYLQFRVTGPCGQASSTSISEIPADPVKRGQNKSPKESQPHDSTVADFSSSSSSSSNFDPFTNIVESRQGSLSPTKTKQLEFLSIQESHQESQETSQEQPKEEGEQIKVVEETKVQIQESEEESNAIMVQNNASTSAAQNDVAESKTNQSHHSRKSPGKQTQGQEQQQQQQQQPEELFEAKFEFQDDIEEDDDDDDSDDDSDNSFADDEFAPSSPQSAAQLSIPTTSNEDVVNITSDPFPPMSSQLNPVSDTESSTSSAELAPSKPNSYRRGMGGGVNFAKKGMKALGKMKKNLQDQIMGQEELMEMLASSNSLSFVHDEDGMVTGCTIMETMEEEGDDNDSIEEQPMQSPLDKSSEEQQYQQKHLKQVEESNKSSHGLSLGKSPVDSENPREKLKRRSRSAEDLFGMVSRRQRKESAAKASSGNNNAGWGISLPKTTRKARRNSKDLLSFTDHHATQPSPRVVGSGRLRRLSANKRDMEASSAALLFDGTSSSPKIKPSKNKSLSSDDLISMVMGGRRSGGRSATKSFSLHSDVSTPANSNATWNTNGHGNASPTKTVPSQVTQELALGQERASAPAAKKRDSLSTSLHIPKVKNFMGMGALMTGNKKNSNSNNNNELSRSEHITARLKGAGGNLAKKSMGVLGLLQGKKNSNPNNKKDLLNSLATNSNLSFIRNENGEVIGCTVMPSDDVAASAEPTASASTEPTEEPISEEPMKLATGTGESRRGKMRRSGSFDATRPFEGGRRRLRRSNSSDLIVEEANSDVRSRGDFSFESHKRISQATARRKNNYLDDMDGALFTPPGGSKPSAMEKDNNIVEDTVNNITECLAQIDAQSPTKSLKDPAEERVPGQLDIVVDKEQDCDVSVISDVTFSETTSSRRRRAGRADSTGSGGRSRPHRRRPRNSEIVSKSRSFQRSESSQEASNTPSVSGSRSGRRRSQTDTPSKRERRTDPKRSLQRSSSHRRSSGGKGMKEAADAVRRRTSEDSSHSNRSESITTPSIVRKPLPGLQESFSSAVPENQALIALAEGLAVPETPPTTNGNKITKKLMMAEEDSPAANSTHSDEKRRRRRNSSGKPEDRRGRMQERSQSWRNRYTQSNNNKRSQSPRRPSSTRGASPRRPSSARAASPRRPSSARMSSPRRPSSARAASPRRPSALSKVSPIPFEDSGAGADVAAPPSRGLERSAGGSRKLISKEPLPAEETDEKPPLTRSGSGYSKRRGQRRRSTVSALRISSDVQDELERASQSEQFVPQPKPMSKSAMRRHSSGILPATQIRSIGMDGQVTSSIIGTQNRIESMNWERV